MANKLAISEAIILAGGMGSRLQSVVSHVPKPMAPVLHTPFLEILIDRFFGKGIRHFILSVGYMSECIVQHFENRYQDRKISYAVERKRLDTGGAIRLALTLAQTEYVLILNGDTLFDIDLAMANAMLEKVESPIIFGRALQDVSRYGEILYNQKDGLITGYLEKGQAKPGVINAGIYILPKHLLDDFALHTPFSMERDFFSKLTGAVGFRVIISNDYFIDIGVPEDYLRAQTELRTFID